MSDLTDYRACFLTWLTENNYVPLETAHAVMLRINASNPALNAKGDGRKYTFEDIAHLYVGSNAPVKSAGYEKKVLSDTVSYIYARATNEKPSYCLPFSNKALDLQGTERADDRVTVDAYLSEIFFGKTEEKDKEADDVESIKQEMESIVSKVQSKYKELASTYASLFNSVTFSINAVYHIPLFKAAPISAFLNNNTGAELTDAEWEQLSKTYKGEEGKKQLRRLIYTAFDIDLAHLVFDFYVHSMKRVGEKHNCDLTGFACSYYIGSGKHSKHREDVILPLPWHDANPLILGKTKQVNPIRMRICTYEGYNFNHDINYRSLTDFTRYYDEGVTLHDDISIAYFVKAYKRYVSCMRKMVRTLLHMELGNKA